MQGNVVEVKMFKVEGILSVGAVVSRVIHQTEDDASGDLSSEQTLPDEGQVALRDGEAFHVDATNGVLGRHSPFQFLGVRHGQRGVEFARPDEEGGVHDLHLVLRHLLQRLKSRYHAKLVLAPVKLEFEVDSAQ